MVRWFQSNLQRPIRKDQFVKRTHVNENGFRNARILKIELALTRVRDDTFFRDLWSLTIILPNHDLRSLTIIVWKSEEKVSTITHDHDRRSFPDHLNMSNMAFHNINSIKTQQNMKMNKILRLFKETHYNFNKFMGKFPYN